LRGLLQQQVTDVMAEGVVDVLEIVQVNEQQPTLMAAARAGSECMMEPVYKKPPVGQASERVVKGQMHNFIFGLEAAQFIELPFEPGLPVQRPENQEIEGGRNNRGEHDGIKEI